MDCLGRMSISENKQDIFQNHRNEGNTQYDNEMKKWKANKKNKYALNDGNNKKERTFIEGKGFVDESPIKSEKSVLSKLSFVIGICLLIYFTTDWLGSNVIADIMKFFGVNIYSSFFSDQFMGNEWAILAVNIVTSVIKYSIPIVVMWCMFKLPRRLVMPIKTGHSSEVIGGIAFALMVAVVFSTINWFFPIVNSINFTAQSYWTDGNIITEHETFITSFIYTMFDIFIVSIFIEILIHGIIMTVLRQFGNIFAIIFTTVISVMMLGSFPACFSYGFLTLLTGIFFIRSGSILTGVAIRIAYELYFFCMMLIHNGDSPNVNILTAYYMCIILVMACLICVIYTARRNRNLIVVNSNTVMSSKEKTGVFMSTIPMVAWITISFIFTALNYYI
jgi:hypothetical protein